MLEIDLVCVFCWLRRSISFSASLPVLAAKAGYPSGLPYPYYGSGKVVYATLRDYVLMLDDGSPLDALPAGGCIRAGFFQRVSVRVHAARPRTSFAFGPAPNLHCSRATNLNASSTLLGSLRHPREGGLLRSHLTTRCCLPAHTGVQASTRLTFPAARRCA